MFPHLLARLLSVSLGVSFVVVSESAIAQQLTGLAASPIRLESNIRLNPQPLRLGDVQPGILDRYQASLLDGRYTKSFQFYGQQGTPVRVRLIGSKDNRPTNNLRMTPYLLVYGPDGQLIARTGAVPNSVEAYVMLRLPRTGNYTAVITTVEPKKVGRYWFAVQYLPKNMADTLNNIEISEIPSAFAEYQIPLNRSSQVPSLLPSR